jgi:hypothetical protein
MNKMLWNNTDREKTKYLDESLSPSANISANLQNKIFRITSVAHSRASYTSRSLKKQFRDSAFSVTIYTPIIISLSLIRVIFKEIHLHTTLIQGISTIFVDKMPTNLVFKKVHPMLASKFLNFTTQSENP